MRTLKTLMEIAIDIDTESNAYNLHYVVHKGSPMYAIECNGKYTLKSKSILETENAIIYSLIHSKDNYIESLTKEKEAENLGFFESYEDILKYIEMSILID